MLAPEHQWDAELHQLLCPPLEVGDWSALSAALVALPESPVFSNQIVLLIVSLRQQQCTLILHHLGLQNPCILQYNKR